MGFGDDETDALGRAAPAGVVEPVLEGVAVVERNFVTRTNVVDGNNPHAVIDDVGPAVGFAGVIDETGDVGGIAAIEGPVIV